MAHLLHVTSSPRGDRSASIDVAQAYVDGILAADRASTVDVLDVWTEDLPAFDGPALGAKYAALSGVERTPEQKRIWARIEALAQRFHDAQIIVIGTPMWNFGIPYRLKHLIDAVSQKDVLFRFDGANFEGMLSGRRAVLVCARGIGYGTGTPTPEAEFDFQKSYMLMWLKFVGITDVETIVVERTLLGADADVAAREAGRETAQALARG